MQKWMQGMSANGEAGGDGQAPLQFRFIRPGAIVPGDVLVTVPLPPNMSIVISKEGDQPAKIVVKRGDEKWEVTEKELDKLPADVRPHVERMLGRGLMGIVGGVPSLNGIGGGATSLNFEPGLSSFDRMEKRLDEMDRRMDKLLKAVEEMGESHGPSPGPAEKPRGEAIADPHRRDEQLNCRPTSARACHRSSPLRFPERDGDRLPEAAPLRFHSGQCRRVDVRPNGHERILATATIARRSTAGFPAAAASSASR